MGLVFIPNPDKSGREVLNSASLVFFMYQSAEKVRVLFNTAKSIPMSVVVISSHFIFEFGRRSSNNPVTGV